jgi:hypothetical protein
VSVNTLVLFTDTLIFRLPLNRLEKVSRDEDRRRTPVRIFHIRRPRPPVFDDDIYVPETVSRDEFIFHPDGFLIERLVRDLGANLRRGSVILRPVFRSRGDRRVIRLILGIVAPREIVDGREVAPINIVEPILLLVSSGSETSIYPICTIGI